MPSTPPFSKRSYAEAIDWALDGLERGQAQVHAQPDNPESWEGSTMERIDPPELYIQIAGRMHIYFESREYVELMPGDFCLLPRQCPHRNIVVREQQPGFDCLDLRFGRGCIEILQLRTFVGQYPNHTNSLLQNYPRYPLIRRQFIRALDLLTSDRPILQRAGRGALIQALAILVDCISAKRTTPGCIEACKLLISANISDPNINVSTLAGNLKRNRDYLSHAFHKETGVRLTDYINQCRIDEAKELLRCSSMRIADIARLCGFSSPVYFGKVFHRYEGQTPTAFRKNEA